MHKIIERPAAVMGIDVRLGSFAAIAPVAGECRSPARLWQENGCNTGALFAQLRQRMVPLRGPWVQEIMRIERSFQMRQRHPVGVV